MEKLDLYEVAPLSAYVPTLDTLQLMTAEGELNQEFKQFMFADRDSSLLEGKRIAILATDGVEELEIMIPLNYLRESGAHVSVVSPEKPEFPASFGVKMPELRKTHIMTVRLMENSGWLPIDRFLNDVSAKDFDALIVPGGVWNPDFLRTNPKAQQFVRDMVKADKILASLCHGPQVLISANVLAGRQVTGYWAIHADLVNAGATVYDKPVVVDDKLITSRFPYDLPRFLKAIVDGLASK